MSLDVPEEFDEFPFEAKRFVLAEANDAADIKRQIHDLVGIPFDPDDRNRQRFTKNQMAAVLMALGGPTDHDVADGVEASLEEGPA